MTFLIILITISILLAWPKVTFCNAVLSLVTTGVVSLIGPTGGPDFFLWIYALFSVIAFYDGLSKRQKEEIAAQDKINQADLARAMRDNKKKRNNLIK